MKIEQKRKVRLIPHEAALDTGSFEVAYACSICIDWFGDATSQTRSDHDAQ